MKDKKPILPIMLDLETLSTRSNAAVIEIALVPFGRNIPAETNKQFHRLIKPDYGTYNFHVDPDTVNWHQQLKTGKVEQAEERGENFVSVVADLHKYLFNLAADFEIHLWCKGKDFDIPILANFLNNQTRILWKFWNTHCVRDLCMFAEIHNPRKNTHSALEDCYNQIASVDMCVYKYPQLADSIFGVGVLPDVYSNGSGESASIATGDSSPS